MSVLSHIIVTPTDPILSTYDAECDPGRDQATIARDLLEAYKLDPYDDNDYGNIPE